MGEWSEYFEDNPEENPANQVDGRFDPKEAAKRRAAAFQATKISEESGTLLARMEQIGREAQIARGRRDNWACSTVRSEFTLRARSLCAVIFFAATHIAHAEVDVSFAERTDWPTTISIYGAITRDDVQKVQAALAAGKDKPNLKWDYLVRLNSTGGDVDAAMKIGKLLRQTRAHTSVARALVPDQLLNPPSDVSCVSACVLIFIAGSDRADQMGVRIGIHRPYSVPPMGSTTAPDRRGYAALTSRVKLYLEEMGAPIRLFEEMMRVPPEQVRWLSEEELTTLGVVGVDPSYVDFGDSVGAQSYGITKQEFLRRKALGAKSCRPLLSQPTKNLRLDEEWPSEKYDKCVRRVYMTGSP